VQQLAAVRGVGEGVVDRPALGLEDGPVRPALVGRAQAQRHLVGLVRARREPRLDEAQHEQRRVRAQRHGGGDLDVVDLARLGGEPALGDDPLVERLVVQEGEIAGGDGCRDVGHSSSSFTSWNQ
jgi:hypothetical protein